MIRSGLLVFLLLVSCCWLLVASCKLLIAYCLLPLPIAHLPIAYKTPLVLGR